MFSCLIQSLELREAGACAYVCPQSTANASCLHRLQVCEPRAKEEVGGRTEGHGTLGFAHQLPLDVLHVDAVRKYASWACMCVCVRLLCVYCVCVCVHCVCCVCIVCVCVCASQPMLSIDTQVRITSVCLCVFVCVCAYTSQPMLVIDTQVRFTIVNLFCERDLSHVLVQMRLHIHPFMLRIELPGERQLLGRR